MFQRLVEGVMHCFFMIRWWCVHSDYVQDREGFDRHRYDAIRNWDYVPYREKDAVGDNHCHPCRETRLRGVGAVFSTEEPRGGFPRFAMVGSDFGLLESEDVDTFTLHECVDFLTFACLG